MTGSTGTPAISSGSSGCCRRPDGSSRRPSHRIGPRAPSSRSALGPSGPGSRRATDSPSAENSETSTRPSAQRTQWAADPMTTTQPQQHGGDAARNRLRAHLRGAEASPGLGPEGPSSTRPCDAGDPNALAPPTVALEYLPAGLDRAWKIKGRLSAHAYRQMSRTCPTSVAR